MNALRRWAPPQEVSVTLMYVDGTTEALWTTEAVRAPAGVDPESRWFLAVGPAGKPVRPICRTFVQGLPAKGMVVLVTETDRLGRRVYGTLKHTLN